MRQLNQEYGHSSAQTADIHRTADQRPPNHVLLLQPVPDQQQRVCYVPGICVSVLHAHSGLIYWLQKE